MGPHEGIVCSCPHPNLEIFQKPQRNLVLYSLSPRIQSIVFLAVECEMGEKVVFTFAYLFSLLLIFILCPCMRTFHQRKSNHGSSDISP